MERIYPKATSAGNTKASESSDKLGRLPIGQVGHNWPETKSVGWTNKFADLTPQVVHAEIASSLLRLGKAVARFHFHPSSTH
jgi:hypothetical protein